MYVDKLRVRKVGMEVVHDMFNGYIACHSVSTAVLHVLVHDAAEWNPFCITTERSTRSGGVESRDVPRGAPQSCSSSTPPCLDLTLFQFPCQQNQQQSAHRQLLQLTKGQLITHTTNR